MVWSASKETRWRFDIAKRSKPWGARDHLNDFVTCYHAENRHDRKETERFKPFSYDDLLKRDKVNLDIFWPKDEILEDSANLPVPT